MDIKRPQTAVDEIAEMPAVHTTECVQWLRDRGGRLAPETLVFVAREAKSVKNIPVVELAGQMLTGAGVPPTSRNEDLTIAERVIRKAARKFHFLSDTPTLEIYWGRCLDSMWKAVLEGREAKPFWEQDFAVALYGKCLDVGRPLYRRRLKDVSIDEAASSANAATDPDVFADLALGELLGAIRDLQPELARAARLSWIDDLPVDSPNGRSVADALKVSPSYAHRLLRKARTALAEHPVIRTMRREK